MSAMGDRRAVAFEPLVLAPALWAVADSIANVASKSLDCSLNLMVG